MNYRIEAMHCDGCARAVRAAIREADETANVTIDVPGRRASIDSTRPDAVLAALAEAGFPATPA